jgi:sulfoquinovosidase
MRNLFRISESFQLSLTRNTIRVTSKDGTPVLSLPRENFIGAGVHISGNPPKNNHYHKMTQTVEASYTNPTIEIIQETPLALVMKGTLEPDHDAIPYTLEFMEDDNGFSLVAKIIHPRVNRLFLTYESSPDERFYGFGEQFTYVDFTGKRFPLITGEQGLGRGAQPCSAIIESRSGSSGDAFTTYAPIAITVTSEHRALYVENSRIMFIDVKDTNPEQVNMEIWSRRLDLRVWKADSLLDAIALHTAYTGRYEPLPRWAHDVILGLRGGLDQVESILTQCKRFKVPVGAIWIEDWVGRRGPNYGPPLWWRWVPNENVYPDFKNWVADLHSRGIKVLTYFNPFIADDENFSQYQEAMKNGYFVMDSSENPYHKKTGMGYGYYMVDLSNRRAYEWFKQIMISNVLDYGIDGWMADYGEYLSLDSMVANGISGEEYHQQYALDWIRLNHEVVQQTGRSNDMLVFNRCGFANVNTYAQCFWEGDQNVTWDEHDGLGSSIVGLLSSGISGMAINHSDIGGHTTLVNPLLTMVRSKELLWRWTELAVFLPVFRTHVGTLQTPNHQFYSCDESFAFFALMGRLHHCFIDYFLFLESEASDRGYPLIRHTMLHDETASLYDLRYQFMLGEDMVVFPIWSEGTTQICGYLPQGEWVSPWDVLRYAGGAFITVNVPFGKPAFFLRNGSAWGLRLLEAVSEFISEETELYRSLADIHPNNLSSGEALR